MGLSAAIVPLLDGLTDLTAMCPVHIALYFIVRSVEHNPYKATGQHRSPVQIVTQSLHSFTNTSLSY
jgi:hypothetical protein